MVMSLGVVIAPYSETCFNSSLVIESPLSIQGASSYDLPLRRACLNLLLPFDLKWTKLVDFNSIPCNGADFC